MHGHRFFAFALAVSTLWLFGVANVAAQPACKVRPFAGGALNSAAEEYRISFAPDGQSAHFARSKSFFQLSRKATIYVTQLRGGRWSEPQVASFSGTHADIDPFITKDGNRIYFSSIRPVDGSERADLDIWYVEKSGESWGEPVNLGPSVNSPADELYASITPKGSLVFGSDRAEKGKNWDLYEVPALLPAPKPAQAMNARINTKGWEYDPVVVPLRREGKTQQMLLFAALDRKGGRGLGDLFITPFDTKLPLQPEPVRSAINSPADEYHPSLTPDGKTLVFVRRKGGTASNGDFMEATWPACAFGPTLG